jgi:Ca2+-binding EF-hand superfamily protein
MRACLRATCTSRMRITRQWRCGSANEKAERSRPSNAQDSAAADYAHEPQGGEAEHLRARDGTAAPPTTKHSQSAPVLPTISRKQRSIASCAPSALSGMGSSEGSLSDFFASVDNNGDGLLDLQEFEGVLQQLGVVMPSEHALKGLFDMLDQEGSGSISMKELQLSLRWVRSCEQCQKLRSHAYTFDGILSIQQQIRRALAANAVRVMDLFREWDENGDGLLSAKEFRSAMPLIGIYAAREEIDELFNSMDGTP